MNQTIYALSTAYGKSGVAVIRISGDNALEAIKKMTGIDSEKIKPRYAYLTDIKSLSGDCLDKALVLYFKAPYSFTGEDSVEIQCHGSKAVISSVLENLSSLDNYRLAEPGEFSKRSFYHNKMDLTEAEGLADLIDAETSEQQKYALRQMSGCLKNLYESWRETLLKVMAHLEAYIDFPDEELPPNIIDDLQNTVFKVKKEIESHLSSSNVGERLRDGFRVVILGEPNAGKSSLLNKIADREAVIVSDIAGTTRDAIDIYLDIDGYPVIFTDTAGLRNTTETIEQKGIELAYERAKEADIVICLFDGLKNIPQEFEKIDKNKKIYVANKVDKMTDSQKKSLTDKGFLLVSAKYNQGIETILKAISGKIKEKFEARSGVLVTRQRYREALKNTVNYLQNFNFNKEIELSAEDIRLACREIGKITGRIEVDEILDKIFGSFCIGK
ncbi:MAG: tRNA uridine-5-carboxymethylaminomethyl(34) synthesis GTPase MnmE [bacterium]|nr:tRNA uridine-5-carboxymethylaminomethyl(34) synthesis GTPase MnmE [bacterium]MDY2830373.1 tRNA uridine-5-carboxymethylaminomethyl(34) synthesis GTPase MnmE [Alphaproteobacteria bacterium]